MTDEYQNMWTKDRDFKGKNGTLKTKPKYTLANLLIFKNKE